MSAYLPPVPTPLVIVGTLPTTLVDTHPLHPISASDAPTLLDFPDTQEGRNASGAFDRLRAFVHQGFQSCDLESSVPRQLWLRIFSTLLIDFHNSIRVTHSDHPFPAAFADLNSYETPHIELLNQTFSSFSRFFTDYKADPKAWDICLRCLDECHIPINDAEWKSVLKSCSQNIRAAHSTIVNNSIRTLHSEAEAWRLDQLEHLRNDFFSFLTNAKEDVLEVSADPRLEAWIKKTQSRLRSQLRSSITDTVITEILEPWATTAFDDVKAQQLIILDQRRKALESAATIKISNAKEAARLRTVKEAQTFFEQQLDIRTTQSKADIIQQEAELREAAEIEISAFKHMLKIEVDERKEKLRASFALTPSSSTPSLPAVRTNRPRKRVDPTSRPLPRSRSISRSCGPSHGPRPLGRSPNMVTPRASHVTELPPTCALKEPALGLSYLEPPPTNMSVGPPSDSFEETMMKVDKSNLVAFEYPPNPSALDFSGPPNTAAPPTQSLEPAPSTTSTDPATSAVLSAITQMSLQLTSITSLLRSWALGLHFSFFLDRYVLIRSHDLDSHDRLPVQQNHFTGNSIVPSFCTSPIVPFLW